MNKLVYFSLVGLKMYDKHLSSSEYQHNQWFNLPFVEALWPGHTVSRVHKLDTPWDLAGTVCPIPSITNNETNFEVVMDSLAEEFVQLVEQTNKTPYVCWSGGIDSTTILVSILKVASAEFLKKMVVLHSENSIKENSYFYYNYIDKKLITGDIDKFIVDENNYNQILVADGEAGNQCMGQNSVQKLMYNNQYELLNGPWRDLTNLKDLAIGGTDFSIQLIKDSIEYSPVPIETGFDFLWWLNFNFKFDDVLVRKIPYYTSKLTPIQTKTFFEESLFRFFAHPKMQMWSMLSTNQRREGLKITQKYVPKKYIHDFDRNDFYFYNKKEEGSNSKLLFDPKYLPNSTSLVAIDSDWEKYKMSDPDTRNKVGKLLQRV